MITFKLSNTIQHLQRSGSPHLAAGLMVRVHTLRAMTRPELRALGRRMWSELARGFPHVEEAAIGVLEVVRVVFDTRDSDQFPIGLTPEPL